MQQVLTAADADHMQCRGAFPCIRCQERGLRHFCRARPEPRPEGTAEPITLAPLLSYVCHVSLPPIAAITPEPTPTPTPTSSPLSASATQFTTQAAPPTPTTPSGSRPSPVPSPGTPAGGQEQLPSFPCTFGSTSVPILPPLPPQVAYHEEAAKPHEHPGFTPDMLKYMITLVPLGQPTMVWPAKPHPPYCLRWGILQKISVPAAQFRNRFTHLHYTPQTAPPDGLHLADIVYYEYSPVPPPIGVIDPRNFMAGSDEPPLPIPEGWLPPRKRRAARAARPRSAQGTRATRTARATRRRAPY